MINCEFKSITKFYCNNKLDIVLRLRSFARRIRIRSKIYNIINYEYVGPNKFDYINKLIYDRVDYSYVANFLLNELTNKTKFLSNLDNINIFGLLSRIKSPIYFIKNSPYLENNLLHDDTIHTYTNCSNEINSGNNVEYKSDYYNKNTPFDCKKYSLVYFDDNLIKSISDLQKSIISYLINIDTNHSLTDKERYYMICALSRESSIINKDTWHILFKKVECVMALKADNSLYRYLPYQIANIMLIYDQINRWISKRYNTKNHKNDLQLRCKETNLSFDSDHNRMGLNILSIGINILLYELNQLKSDKIIKLLYLLSNNNNCNTYFFHASYYHLESTGFISNIGLSQIFTLARLFLKCYLHESIVLIEFIRNSPSSIYPCLYSHILHHKLDSYDYDTNIISNFTIIYKRVQLINLCMISITDQFMIRLSHNEQYIHKRISILGQLSGLFESYDCLRLISFIRERDLSYIETDVLKSSVNHVRYMSDIVYQMLKSNRTLEHMLDVSNKDKLGLCSVYVNYFNVVFNTLNESSNNLL